MENNLKNLWETLDEKEVSYLLEEICESKIKALQIANIFLMQEPKFYQVLNSKWVFWKNVCNKLTDVCISNKSANQKTKEFIKTLKNK